MIVWGGLPPGTRLVEIELEQQLDVSRTPIRSALNRLVAEGHVVSSGGRKEFLKVAPLSRDDAIELFEMVGHLESIPARTVALLEPKARAEIAAKLRACNREIAKADKARQSDASQLFDLDARFHQVFVDAGAGPKLHKHLQLLHSQVERYDRLYMSAYFRHLEPTLAEHERIAGAIQRGDADAAETAVRLNWTNSGERLTVVIGAVGGGGTWRPGPLRPETGRLSR